MIAEPVSPSAFDQRLDEVLAAYLKAVESGESPDRQALLARHPDLAEEIGEFFYGLDQFELLAAPLREVRQSTGLGQSPLTLEAGVRQVPVGGSDQRDGVETIDDVNETGPFIAADRPASKARPPATVSIPGYEILGVLGRGGMGVVYQARQVKLKRLVALKMIRAGDQADEAELARFRIEAEAVARLQHPNIVQIYEVGEHLGQPFCWVRSLPRIDYAALA